MASTQTRLALRLLCEPPATTPTQHRPPRNLTGFGMLPPSRLSRAVVAGAPRVHALPPCRLLENTLCLADEMVICPRWGV
jgi:hypothetical protein